jgi:hypothetical protein
MTFFALWGETPLRHVGHGFLGLSIESIYFNCEAAKSKFGRWSRNAAKKSLRRFKGVLGDYEKLVIVGVIK